MCRKKVSDLALVNLHLPVTLKELAVTDESCDVTILPLTFFPKPVYCGFTLKKKVCTGLRAPAQLDVAWAWLGRAWLGRGLDVAWAWLGRGVGLAWAWLGRGVG